jgi:hypothetical protein
MLLSDKRWQGMRTQGQIRSEEGIKMVHKKDSIYTEMVRKRREFTKVTEFTERPTCCILHKRLC